MPLRLVIRNFIFFYIAGMDVFKSCNWLSKVPPCKFGIWVSKVYYLRHHFLSLHLTRN